MAVPARKKSKTKSKIRRHINMKITYIKYNICKTCGNAKIPYCICRKCGYYNLKKILNIKKENTIKKKK
jgi:large subunit ribosomal protein L32